MGDTPFTCAENWTFVPSVAVGLAGVTAMLAAWAMLTVVSSNPSKSQTKLLRLYIRMILSEAPVSAGNALECNGE